MRIIYILVILGILGCQPQRTRINTVASSEVHSTSIAIDPQLLGHLEVLAETSSVEPARCIAGAWNGERLELQAALDAPYLIFFAMPDVVAWAWWDCPGITTVALWHGHIWNYWWHRGALTPPLGRCRLSPEDRIVALDPRAPALHFISVKRGVSCIWFRRERELIPIPIRREEGDR